MALITSIGDDMGQEVVLTHETEDYRYVITRMWCMCGGCEDFRLSITDLESHETVSFDSFSYHEMEPGYEVSNLAATVLSLTQEVKRLRTLAKSGSEDGKD